MQRLSRTGTARNPEVAEIINEYKWQCRRKKIEYRKMIDYARDGATIKILLARRVPGNKIRIRIVEAVQAAGQAEDARLSRILAGFSNK